jgi:hypothetical protein
VSAGRWPLIGSSIGLAVLVGGALFLVTTSDSPQGGSSPAGSPFSPRTVARPANAPRSTQATHPKIADRAEVGASPLDRGGTEATPVSGNSDGERLKSYERLWTDPDAAQLRAAEQKLLKRLKRLPPADLVALLGKGPSTRSANLMLITMQNARGPRRIRYENALLLEMESAFEQPEKLKLLYDVAVSLDLSRRNAKAADALVEKLGLAKD